MLNKIYQSVLALILGHYTVFKHSFKKRVTLEYPEVKPELSDKFRGKHVFNADKCKGCGICQRVCPAGAITITKQNAVVQEYVIDYKKCIFCGNCVYYCNSGAIQMSKDFELATDNKSDLSVRLKKVEVDVE